MMDIEKLIEELHIAGAGNPGNIFDVAATALQYLSEGADEVNATLQEQIAESKKLWADLERVKRENDALWTYIEIVDREYRRYMDRDYINRLNELKKVWKRGQKEN